MEALNLVAVCLTAFAAVFVLLGVLAALMRLITSLFPERHAESGPAVIAAPTAAYSFRYPFMKVTSIEEES